MNKKQLYALGIWFIVIGGIMYTRTVSGPWALPTIAECNSYILITMLVGKLVGAICIIVGPACFICGWLVKEDTR